MNLVKSILTKNPCYTAGRTIAVKGLMLHSVGCSQPNASVFINNWNSANYDRACVHGFIDGNTGTVYQTLPWNHRGWHAGGAANNTHIGVEMCEPACIKYTGGSSFTCSDTATAKACAKRTYEAAVELFAMLCKEYNLDPTKDGVIISHREGCVRDIASNHGDPEHLWNGLNMGYTMNTFRKAVKDKMAGTTATPANPSTGMQATVFKNLSEAEAAAKIGELCKADMKASDILASVSAAQFILESGYGKSELAQNANNCFGMKCSLSGNTWSGSTWDGKSKYVKETKEEYTPGTYTTIIAEFRKYPSVEKSIADHSVYLAGAMNGNKKRYEGLVGCKDYKKAVQIIKDGGYATSSTYVSSLCSIIERFNLTKYDVVDTTTTTSWYRVRKTWADSKSQIGAYKILDNAKACADKNPGYGVFDSDGKKIYPVSTVNTSGCPFLVQVSISDLNIRKGPGTNYAKTGMYTGKGVFTIVEVKTGTGSKAGWGRLKSGAGWISLDYGKRV